MNQDERRIITEYVERVSGAVPAPGAAGGAGGSSGGPWGGASVPATQARPNLPPVDREADALIADLFNRHPEARYRITQTAFVQEAALVEEGGVDRGGGKFVDRGRVADRAGLGALAPRAAQAGGVIFNSNDPAFQTVALGVNDTGNLNFITPDFSTV